MTGDNPPAELNDTQLNLLINAPKLLKNSLIPERKGNNTLNILQ